jgi:hypothetical protein
MDQLTRSFMEGRDDVMRFLKRRGGSARPKITDRAQTF